MYKLYYNQRVVGKRSLYRKKVAKRMEKISKLNDKKHGTKKGEFKR